MTPKARARSVVLAGERRASSSSARIRPRSRIVLPAGGQLPGSVEHIRVEDGPDTGPVRRDKAVVSGVQLRGDGAQTGCRPGGHGGGRVRKLAAENPPQAGPHLVVCRTSKGRQFVVDGGARSERGWGEELGPALAVVDEQRPDMWEIERRLDELVGGPPQPRQIDRVPRAAAQLLQAGHRLRQRRDGESRLRQLRDAEVDSERHCPSM
ncbi:hypothetical protein [Phytoactinopolyspora alkaliphila]|uniref:hypothetical protein n=1 Tax=Phytoactinopolyspora alkaliphila TaxID=1783498 RepID=UPI001FE7FD8D|nr:hypothetical protein [Phytoactinopolyspora alkaliphila]